MPNKPTTDPFPDLPGERFYDISQVAAMFPGRSRRWVENAVKAGKFGTVLHADGCWLIPLSGLREYVRERSVAPGELAPELQGAAGAGKPSNLVQLHKEGT